MSKPLACELLGYTTGPFPAPRRSLPGASGSRGGRAGRGERRPRVRGEGALAERGGGACGDPASGLPVELSANRSIPCRWGFRVDIDPEGSLNVAYDLWVHTDGSPNSYTTPSDEVMIWEYAYQKDDPIGSYQDTLTVGGVAWDLYESANGDTQVHSFLQSHYTTCDELDLGDLLAALVERGSLDDSQYLISIEAGPEVVMGRCRVDTD